MENAIEKVDFEAIHRAIAIGNFGDRIWVYRDESDGTPAGGHVVTGSQETPGDVATGTSGPVALLTAKGLGNLDDALYYADFAHQDDDYLWRYDATGELVGGDGEWRSVVEESIRDGEWVDYYDELRTEIIRQWGENEGDKEAKARIKYLLRRARKGYLHRDGQYPNWNLSDGLYREAKCLIDDGYLLPPQEFDGIKVTAAEVLHYHIGGWCAIVTQEDWRHVVPLSSIEEWSARQDIENRLPRGATYQMIRK